MTIDDAMMTLIVGGLGLCLITLLAEFQTWRGHRVSYEKAQQDMRERYRALASAQKR